MARYTQTEAAQMDTRLENKANAERRQRFFISEVMGGFAGGAFRGYMLVKNPTLAAFGPGERFHLDHVMALGGLYLGRKTSRNAAIARGVGIGALSHIGNGYGEKAAADSET